MLLQKNKGGTNNMSRPYVTISINNKIDELMRHLEEKVMPKLMALPGMIGITLNGGLSRGFADHLSEIDISVYLNDESFTQWCTDKSPIPLGIVKLENIVYDIKIIQFNGEYDRQYGDVELWDLSYAKILHDPENKISELFKEKLEVKVEIFEATNLLWECYWNFQLAGDTCINRRDTMQGHFILNKSIKLLIKSLFIVNKERIPHDKWLVHMSYTLNWKPNKWKERLTEAMNTNNFTVEGLIARQRAIKGLWNEIEDFVKDRCYPEFSLMTSQKSLYNLLVCLVERGEISVTEWQKMANITVLNMDPLYMITEIREGKIILNKEKLLSVKEEDMYSWHFEIITSVIEKNRVN